MRNRDLLRELRKSYTQPGRMRELSQKLQGIDVVFQQLTTIGMLLSFRRLVLAPLKQMLEKRMPLLCQSISEFANQVVRDPNAAVSVPNFTPLVDESSEALFCSRLNATTLKRIIVTQRSQSALSYGFSQYSEVSHQGAS